MIDPTDTAFRTLPAMTPAALGRQLADLAWDGLVDLLSDEAAVALLGELDMLDGDGEPRARAEEELLIFLLWTYSDALERAARARAAPSPRGALDAFHRAVFEDLLAAGSARASELPLLEERVRSRYDRYRRAGARSDLALGRAVIRAIADRSPGAESDEGARFLALRGLAVSAPVADFYESLESL